MRALRDMALTAAVPKGTLLQWTKLSRFAHNAPRRVHWNSRIRLITFPWSSYSVKQSGPHVRQPCIVHERFSPDMRREDRTRARSWLQACSLACLRDNRGTELADLAEPSDGLD
jgi:hypothetical protein